MFRWHRILGLATGLALLAAGRLDAAMAADAVSLRLDFLPTGYHAPLFYGLAKGIYKDAGIDLTVDWFSIFTRPCRAACRILDLSTWPSIRNP